METWEVWLPILAAKVPPLAQVRKIISILICVPNTTGKRGREVSVLRVSTSVGCHTEASAGFLFRRIFKEVF